MSELVSPRHCLAAVLLGLVAIAFGFGFGETYIGRLPDHHGLYLVGVDDAVHAAGPPRPRRTVVVVIDGLRGLSALNMRSVAALRSHGQCRIMDVGPLTVSRPVYAILSTGLEADRTGSRNNDETSPLAAESIWEVAKQAGLEVVGASHLPWFGQLFPQGFTRYHRTEPMDENIFGEPLGDLTLFHPIYVDETGHSYGAASERYAAAVDRADDEVSELLARLDLEKDVVVFTADHGHTARGGHGAGQPEIAHVLTCYAGPNIVRSERLDELDARTFAPSLALLLGLRFPRHMRAGEDRLEAMFDIVDLRKTPEYAAERHVAVTHFRDENARALATWLGGEPGTWSRLYAQEGAQNMRRMWSGLALCLVLFVALSRKSGLSWKSIGTSAAWVFALYGGACFLHVEMRGSLDFTAINSKASYVPAVLEIGFLAGALAIAAHVALLRSGLRLLRDQLTALALLLGANILHPLAFRWPLGFPLPNRQLLLFPFFGAIMLVAGGLLTIAMGATLYAQLRWAGQRRRN